LGGGARGREFRCKGPGSAFGTPEPHAVAARKLDCDLVADEFETALFHHRLFHGWHVEAQGISGKLPIALLAITR